MTQSCSSPNSTSHKSYSSLIPKFKWPAVPKHICLPQSPPLVSSFTTPSAYPFPTSSSPPPTLPMPVAPNRQRTTSTSSVDTIRSKQNFSTLDELIQYYGRSEEPPSAGTPVKSKRKQCNRSKSSNKAKQRKAKRTSSPAPTTTCLASVLHSDHLTEFSTLEVGAGTVPNYQAWAESSTPVGDDASSSNCDSQSPWSPSPSSIYRWNEIDPFVSSSAKPQFDGNSGFDHAVRTAISRPLNGHDDDSPIHMHHAAPTVDDFELSIFLQQPHFEFWDKNDAEHVVCPAQLHLTLKDPHELHDFHLDHHGQQSVFPTSLPDIQVIDVECFNTPVPSLLTDHDPDSNYRVTYIGSTIRDHKRGVGGDKATGIPKDVGAKPGICIQPNWSRLHFDEGWFMSLWIPIPTRLFAKKETRTFTVRSRLWIGKEDEEPEAVVGERAMTVSHLLREREMI